MRTQSWVLSILLFSVAPVYAESVQPTVVVGSVYGKAITAADIKLTAPIDSTVQFDARNTEQWELMSRISIAFGKPINDRFVDENKIAATADEIKAFKDFMRKQMEKQITDMEEKLTKAKAELASPNLAAERKAELEKQLAMYEKILPGLRDATKHDPGDAMAKHMIVSWKTERDLHRKFGGRVIFQQFGLEALDARKQLFELAEKNGDLKFEDAGVRHMFYYYSNMKHTPGDAKLLERPWFFGEDK